MRRIAVCAATLAGLLVATQRGRLSGEEPSPPAAEKVIVQEDVVYGRVHGAGLLADIAWPESEAPLPAIISVHGGRWRGGHKRDASTINVKEWAGFGFFAMSIDYRLKGCTEPPACYQDVQCAIRFVHANAAKYNVDPKRIFLIGQSAGGHMVSLAATLGEGPFPRTGGWEEASNDFAAAISVAAAYDLPTLDWGNLWTPPGVDKAEARALASPNRHVTKDSKPLLILHSDNDTSVPIANALGMVEALKKAGARHTFHRYPEMGHMGINEEVIARSLEFIKAHSPEKEPDKKKAAAAAPAAEGENAAATPPGRTILPLRAFQQTTSYTCGPAVLLSLLRFHGHDGDELRIAGEAKCTPGKGTSPQDMVAWLEHNGFDVSWGENGSLRMLRENLGRGIPTVVEWIDWGGHWALVVGYDTRGTESERDDLVFFADPADSLDGERDGLTSFPARRFESMWFDAFLFDRPMHRVQITAVPRKTPG